MAIIFGATIAAFGATLLAISSCLAFQAARQSGKSGRKMQAGESLGAAAAVAISAAETVVTGMMVVAISAATIRIFFIAFPWTNPPSWRVQPKLLRPSTGNNRRHCKSARCADSATLLPRG